MTSQIFATRLGHKGDDDQALRLPLTLPALVMLGCTAVPPAPQLPPPVDRPLPAGEAGHAERALVADDGTALYLQGYREAGSAEAVVLVVHGLRDHGGRYAGLARSLAKRGWPTYALDLRGHGRSAGPRAWTSRFERYVDDVALAVEAVREAEPGAPLFLLGHSMGGVIAALYAERPDARIDGLILSAPALEVDVGPLARCGANLVADLSPASPLFALDMSHWSRDPAVIADNQADPLVLQSAAPIQTGVQLLEAAAEALRGAPFVRVPTLALHGDADLITSPSGSRRFVESVRAEHKALRLYRGAFHDLWHEPEREAITADLRSFLEAHDQDPPSPSGEPEPDAQEPGE